MDIGQALHKWVRQEDYVVFNATAGVDIYYTSQYGFIPYYLPARGKAFSDLTNLMATGRKIFLLNIEQRYKPGRWVNDEGLDWLYNHWVPVKPVAVLSTVDLTLPTADPLYALYSRTFLASPAPPDAGNDFEYAPGSIPFSMRFRVQFKLYEVAGKKAIFRDFRKPVVLVKRYGDFNIFEQGGVFFPIPVDDPEDPYVALRSNYRSLNGNSLEEAEGKVDAWKTRGLSLDRLGPVNF